MFSGVIERDQRYYGLTTRSEKKIREVVDMDAIQFGFMLGKGTMDAIFIARQLQERFFFKCYLAAPRVTLGYCRGGSLTTRRQSLQFGYCFRP